MSTATILLNYKEAIRQAEKLEEAARKLDRIAGDRMGGTEASLKSAWSSDNSDAFYQKMDIVKQQIENDAKNLRSSAKAIRNIAESIKKSELEAERIARERSYRVMDAAKKK